MDHESTPGTPENPLIFPATSLAAFAMGIVLLSRTADAGIVSYAALGFLAMNLALLNLKHYNLSRRHNRLLGLVRLRARLAEEAASGHDLSD